MGRAMVNTEETAGSRRDWHEGWRGGWGAVKEPRRGTFQMGADVSKAEASERQRVHFGRCTMDMSCVCWQRYRDVVAVGLVW